MQVRVFIDKVALAEVAEGLMGKDSRQIRVDDDGVLATRTGGAARRFTALVQASFTLASRLRATPKSMELPKPVLPIWVVPPSLAMAVMLPAKSSLC